MRGFYAYTGEGRGIDEKAAWDYIDSGYLPAPRTVLQGRCKAVRAPLPVISVSGDQLPQTVHEHLMAAMGPMANERRAVMFSGGFDSMLIALLAQQAGAHVKAITVQFDDFNPYTVAGAVEFAGKIEIPHHVLEVKLMEFLSAFEALASLTQEPILDLELAIVYAALKKYDQAIAGPVFISGMGSDQWFGDKSFFVKSGGENAHLDWANINEEAHHQVAETHSCRFIFPFLSGPMLAISRHVPENLKKDKKLLRALAVASTIPSRGAQSEIQTPLLVRQILIKTFGQRAWPHPVSSPGTWEDERILRQIVLGLWLEKAYEKIDHQRR